MLSAPGLLTSTCAGWPGWMTAGAIRTSTGSGSGLSRADVVGMAHPDKAPTSRSEAKGSLPGLVTRAPSDESNASIRADPLRVPAGTRRQLLELIAVREAP